MSGWEMRRFWKAVAVVPEAGGYAVTLDGRPLRTPARAPMLLPSQALAEAVAAEWQAQEGRVQPGAMPFTRAANTAIDRVAAQAEAVADEIARFGETDLLCYRAGAPAALQARQAAAWDPLLAWAEAEHGARLVVAEGVMYVPQPAAGLAALRRAVGGYDAFAMTALHDLVALSGSLVIGLAAAAGREAAPRLWEIAHLDEAWQAEQWGEDAEAAATAAHRRAAFLSADRFLQLLRGAPAIA